MRGLARAGNGDLDGAILDFSAALRLDPELPEAHYLRALAEESQGNYAAAMDDYQKYLDLGGGIRHGDQAEVEGKIRDLQARK